MSRTAGRRRDGEFPMDYCRESSETQDFTPTMWPRCFGRITSASPGLQPTLGQAGPTSTDAAGAHLKQHPGVTFWVSPTSSDSQMWDVTSRALYNLSLPGTFWMYMYYCLHVPTICLHVPTIYLHVPTICLHVPTIYLHVPTICLHVPTIYLYVPTMYLHVPTVCLLCAYMCLLLTTFAYLWILYRITTCIGLLPATWAYIGLLLVPICDYITKSTHFCLHGILITTFVCAYFTSVFILFCHYFDTTLVDICYSDFAIDAFSNVLFYNVLVVFVCKDTAKCLV